MGGTINYDDDETHHQPREPFLLINDIPVYFSEDWNIGIGGGLWSTGLAFARYLERRSTDVLANLRRLASVKNSTSRRCSCSRGSSDGVAYNYHEQRLLRHRRVGGAKYHNSVENEEEEEPEGISVLELGSGNGFLSACVLALIMSQEEIPLAELVVTDMKDHLPLIFKTMKANSHVWDELIDGENSVCDGGRLSATIRRDDNRQRNRHNQVILAEHIWGEIESTAEDNKKYDFIFGTDLAYRDSLHGPLISSLLHFSHQRTLCLIGVTMADTQPVFFDRLTDAGFRYEKLADHLLEREFRGGNSFGLFAIQRR